MIEHVAQGETTQVDAPESEQKPDWTNPPDQHHQHQHQHPRNQPGGGGTATAAPTKPRRETKPDRKVDRMPPWKVLLHNDVKNDMGYVVETILELTTLTPQLALVRMLEAHTSGVALLTVTHREYAELLQEQFHSKRLTVSIEPEA